MIAVQELLGASGIKQYTIPDPERLQIFLRQYPEVGTILVEAFPPLRTSFGNDPEMRVTVEADPEVSGEEYVVVAVQTPGSASQALACLTHFDETWLQAHEWQGQDKLLFTIDFV